MNLQITSDAIGQSWLAVLLAVSVSGIFWKPAWAIFFGLGTVALAYFGNWLMVPYAVAFTLELLSVWTEKSWPEHASDAFKDWWSPSRRFRKAWREAVERDAFDWERHR